MVFYFVKFKDVELNESLHKKVIIKLAVPSMTTSVGAWGSLTHDSYRSQRSVNWDLPDLRCLCEYSSEYFASGSAPHALIGAPREPTQRPAQQKTTAPSPTAFDYSVVDSASF